MCKIIYIKKIVTSLSILVK